MEEAKKATLRKDLKDLMEKSKVMLGGTWFCQCGRGCTQLAFLLGTEMSISMLSQEALAVVIGEIPEEQFYEGVELGVKALREMIEHAKSHVVEHTQKGAEA